MALLTYEVSDGEQQTTEDSGHSRLHELGYKQELKRDLSVLANFAFSFSIISVLTGITTLYTTGLTFGGPVTMVYGWLIAGCFTLFVGLSMAEICSSYPTSGGLYFWSARLSGNEWGPFAAWMTGCLLEFEQVRINDKLRFERKVVSERVTGAQLFPIRVDLNKNSISCR